MLTKHAQTAKKNDHTIMILSEVTENRLRAVLNPAIFSEYCPQMFGAKRRPVFNSLA